MKVLQKDISHIGGFELIELAESLIQKGHITSHSQITSLIKRLNKNPRNSKPVNSQRREQ